MGRKKYTASAEQLKPDPQFGSKLLAKFINVMMLDGKKWAAQKFMYQALDIISERIKEEKGKLPPEKADLGIKTKLIKTKKQLTINFEGVTGRIALERLEFIKELLEKASKQEVVA